MRNLLFAAGILCAGSLHSQSVNLVEFATGFTAPVEIAHANDSRMFVVQQNGIIRIVQPDGAINSTNFLNISSKITYGGERGLLGLAFHPQYAANGYFFVYYNDTSGNITVARYTRSTSNPDLADPASEKIILNQPKPFDNHNGGSIHFAPDGYLWVVTGDGGSGGDPNNNAQNKNSLLGKLLRLDINSTGPYNIPAGNPFVGVDGADEVWSYGLRNAWKFNFDTVSGNVMIADVGQGQIEEINRMPLTQPGINYGWRCYEGNSAYNTSGCAAQSTMTFPVAAYNHSGGRCSITGGYVYRGSQFPALQGRYIFADYCSTQIGVLNADDSITWGTASAGNNFSTFGINNQNEMFVAAVSSGKIFRVTTNAVLAAGESTLSSSIKVYPDTATKSIFIEGLKDKNATVEIISFEGRRVLEQKTLNADNRIDVSGIPAGAYFVTINSGGEKAYSKKIILR